MTVVAPRLQTASLLCRLAEPADAAMVLRYRIENREHLAPWEPLRPPDYYTIEHCVRAICDGRQAARQAIGFPFIVLDAGSGEMLASFTLANIVRGAFQACHLGYGVAASSEGRGIMHEALQAGVAWAFDGLGLHRVMANYLPRNARSGRLLEKLGFEREGLARRYLQIAGVWEDHVLTAKTAP
jgi:ribosomal-protein-alanine N-acetyltransferase